MQHLRFATQCKIVPLFMYIVICMVPGVASAYKTLQPNPTIESFLAHYGNNQDQSLFNDVIETADGNFVAVGLSRIPSGGLHWDAWIMKANHAGNILWQKALQTYTPYYPYNAYYDRLFKVQESSFGELIVLGEDGSTERPWLLKFDSNGNLLAHKNLQPQAFAVNRLRLYSLRSTLDGAYVASGSVSTRTYSFPAAIKFDDNLNLVWDYYYQDPSTYAYFDEMISTNDGGYLGVGYRDPDFDQGIALKLAATGTLQWMRVIDPPASLDNLDFSAVVETSTNDFLLLGERWIISYPTGYITSAAAKLNGAGEVVWVKTYENSSAQNNKILDSVFFSDNSLLAIGFLSAKSLLMRLSTSGDIIWQRQYLSGTSDMAMTVKKTSDGGIIAAGNSLVTGQNGMILKGDTRGMLDASCAAQSTPTLQSVSQTFNNFTLTPIMIDQNLTTTTPTVFTLPIQASQSAICQP